MPDLREDLGRLADFVGEPAIVARPGDGASAARAPPTRLRFRGGPVGPRRPRPRGGRGSPPARRGAAPCQLSGQHDTVLPPASTTIWPENAVNGTSPDDVQAALDAGDERCVGARISSEVVQRFGRNILGRNMRILGVFDGDDGMIVRAFPCPPGEQPGAVSMRRGTG